MIYNLQVKACENCPETNSLPKSSDDTNGQCSALDGNQCSGEQAKSFLTSHLHEDQCDDPNHANEAAVHPDETIKKSPEMSIGDERTGTPEDIQEEDKKQEKKVNESPEETICEKYKKKFAQELLSGMEASDGLVLHEFIDGKLNDYLDKVFANALSDNTDQLKEELWDLKDEVEADIEDKFRRAIEKRDKGNMFEWMYVHGQALSNDYKKCCLDMFSRAGTVLKEYGASLDLSKALEVQP